MVFLLSFFLSIAINSSAIFFTEKALENIGTFTVEGGVLAYMLTGFIVGILNFFVKPILKIVSLPVIFVTGGLMLIVINAIILFLTKEILEILNLFDAHLVVGDIKSWLFSSAIFGIINHVLHIFNKRSL